MIRLYCDRSDNHDGLACLCHQELTLLASKAEALNTLILGDKDKSFVCLCLYTAIKTKQIQYQQQIKA